jgi:hypothetical protein
MKSVAAPGANAPATPAPAASTDGGRSFLLLFAAALVLAWLVYRTIRRSSANAEAAKNASDGPSGDGGAPPEGPGSSSGPPDAPGGAGSGESR